MNQSTKDGIAALKAGDKTRAQQLFVAALQENSDDLQAWLWLSGAVESDTDRLECLEQVLRIDPTHELAAKGVAKLKAKGIQFAEPPAQAVEPGIKAESLEWETFENNEPPLTVESFIAEGETESGEPVQVQTLSSLEQVEEEKPVEMAPPLEQEAAGRVGRPLEKIILKTKPSIIPVLLVGILIAAAGVALISILFPWLDRISNMNPIVLFMSMLVVLALLIGAIAVRILQHLFTSYILTNRRFIIEDSLVSRAQKSIALGKIQGISYRQNFWGKIFGLGTVMLAANGESSLVSLHDLKDYLELAESIESALKPPVKE